MRRVAALYRPPLSGLGKIGAGYGLRYLDEAARHDPITAFRAAGRNVLPGEAKEARTPDPLLANRRDRLTSGH